MHKAIIKFKTLQQGWTKIGTMANENRKSKIFQIFFKRKSKRNSRFSSKIRKSKIEILSNPALQR